MAAMQAKTLYCQSSPDSLGLRALNAAAHVIPGHISLEVTLKGLQSQVPDLRATGLGVMHSVWQPPDRADHLRAMFAFRADSDDLFDRRLSAKSLMTAFEVYVDANNVRSPLDLLPAFRNAADALGPSEFCERDTMLVEKYRQIFVRSFASWKRGTLEVHIGSGIALNEIFPDHRWYSARFGHFYQVFRTTDPLSRRDGPTRHDSPCLLTEAEFREHAAPLDSAGYDSLRTELLKRPPRAAPRQP
jgi:hypothetical protein